MLYSPQGREIGMISDVLVPLSGDKVCGLWIETRHGEALAVATPAGLLFEKGHWVLQEDIANDKPSKEMNPVSGFPDTPQDWMVGRLSKTQLRNDQGACIINAGQRISSVTIDLASREGLLHLLEAH
ncbi:MAG: hypothetical protein VKN33_09100 [Candidatus Sericytochromatia bacterium]|nr:hypothetical protein [Candidatus Sericytochromatia bacterium]